MTVTSYICLKWQYRQYKRICIFRLIKQGVRQMANTAKKVKKTEVQTLNGMIARKTSRLDLINGEAEKVSGEVEQLKFRLWKAETKASAKA